MNSWSYLRTRAIIKVLSSTIIIVHFHLSMQSNFIQCVKFDYDVYTYCSLENCVYKTFEYCFANEDKSRNITLENMILPASHMILSSFVERVNRGLIFSVACITKVEFYISPAM